MTNPLVAIEQITYLLFLRQLENLDRERKAAGKPSIYGNRKEADGSRRDYEQCRWSAIKQNPSFQLLNDTVFPWLRGLESWLHSQHANGKDRLEAVTSRLQDAYFTLDPNKTQTLTRAIGLIDDLFRQLDTRSVNADIMGDIFEHLLSEITSSGKNGQFRTPRHVIRLMVNLIDPKYGTSVLDPACGTGGFLINTLDHWRYVYTDPEVGQLEWDGTPRRLHPVYPQPADLNACMHGSDNDRTMVRIAWMNLILHGLEFPDVKQLDSLSKQMSDDASGTYDHVLANPPFTGSVDEGDLSQNRRRFPAGRGNKPLTTKSELLFVWLILDLLKIGGRAAVIVPDGVLFGSTLAHRELRRQLLFDNTLEAVVSLPANMFQPYSGVKTSILMFQKAETPERTRAAGDEPRTREVWFYEIEDEAFSLDQKRKERPGQDNDIWDALEKFKAWKRYLDGQADDRPDADLDALRAAAVSQKYWQPEYWEERWRSVDDSFLKIFPDKDTEKGHTVAIHELWPDLPRDPREAEALVANSQRTALTNVFQEVCVQAAAHALAGLKKRDGDKAVAAAEKAAKDLANRLLRLARDEELLDREFDQYGLNALRPLLDEMRGLASTWSKQARLPKQGDQTAPPDLDAAAERLRPVLREFAKLDGYNVWRRSREVHELPGKLRATDDGKPKRKKTQLSWIVPVRVWARRDTWGEDPETKQRIEQPTHDEHGIVRRDYLDWLRDTLQVFDADGTVNKDHLHLLDPACLEALDLNLSAGRHKPFEFDPGDHPPPAELIGELQAIHGQIQERLERLLAMVEGKA